MKSSTVVSLASLLGIHWYGMGGDDRPRTAPQGREAGASADARRLPASNPVTMTQGVAAAVDVQRPSLTQNCDEHTQRRWRSNG
jgi:hypothetical protein